MRILACSLDSPGFLFPTIHLTMTLRDRGIRTVFVTSAKWTEVITAAGLACVQAVDDGDAFATAKWGDESAILCQRDHIQRAIERWQPELVLGHVMTFGAFLAAERAGVPLIAMGLSTYLFPRIGQNETNTPPERWDRLCWRVGSMLRGYNLCRVRSGLAPVSEDDPTALLGKATILRSVPEFECDAGRLPEMVRYGGACLWEPTRNDPELSAWLDAAAEAGVPVVYADPGRLFNRNGLWQALKKALGGRPVRVAASIGRMGRAAGTIPSNFIVRSYMPQGQILSRAVALVGGGSSTAVLGALTRGVPCVLVPSGGEQPDVAEQCLAAGVGHMIQSSVVTADTLASALDDVITSDTCRHAAQRVADAFARYTTESLVPLFAIVPRVSSSALDVACHDEVG